MPNYLLVQVDPFNLSFDHTNPSSVQQNSFMFRPRTFGITATFHTR